MKKDTLIIVVAALAAGLITGLLWPKLFVTRPERKEVSPSAEFSVNSRRGVDYSIQIAELQRVLEQNPNDVETLIQLGNTYFDGNMCTEAVSVYERALTLKPENPDVLTDLGIMYRRNDRPDKAVQCFREAIICGPDHPQSRFNLGIVLLYDLDDPGGARDAFHEFLRIVPQGSQADTVRDLLASMSPSASRRE